MCNVCIFHKNKRWIKVILSYPIIWNPKYSGSDQKPNDKRPNDADEDDESDVFAGMFGFSLAYQGSTERTEVGEPPEPGQTFHQKGGQPGAEEAAGEGKTQTWGGDLTGHIRHNLNTKYFYLE